MTDLEDWKKFTGEKILRELGINEDQKILDFGCGTGIYSIIASKIVGLKGRIFALDSDERDLVKDLLNEIESKNITNIEFLKTSGEIEFPFKNQSIDVVLWFDVLHLLNKNQRKELIKESYRVLKLNGLILYHATHRGMNNSISIENLSKEMKKNHLNLSLKLKKPMFHWAWIEDSIIYKFIKEEQTNSLNLGNDDCK